MFTQKSLKLPLKLNTGALPLSKTAPAKMLFHIFCSLWLLTTIVVLPGLPPPLLLLTAKSFQSSSAGLTVSCPNCLSEVDATGLLLTFACDMLAGRERWSPEVDGTGLSGCGRRSGMATVMSLSPLWPWSRSMLLILYCCLSGGPVQYGLIPSVVLCLDTLRMSLSSMPFLRNTLIAVTLRQWLVYFLDSPAFSQMTFMKLAILFLPTGHFTYQTPVFLKFTFGFWKKASQPPCNFDK